MIQILERVEIDRLFKGISEVVNVNERLLRELSKGRTADRIGEAMREMAPFLRCYIPYIEQFTDRLKICNELEKEKPLFKNFLSETLLDPELQGLALQSYLIMPVQRLPRYLLLLNEIVKHTKEDHPDYLTLLLAVEEVKSITNQCNQSIKIKEENMYALELSTRIKGCEEDLFSNRRFIKEGPLKKLNSGGFKDYYFFLFNDILIYGKGRGAKDLSTRKYKTYNYHRTLELSNMEVKQFIHEKHENVIEIESSEKSFLVQALDARDCESWLEILNETIGKYRLTIKAMEASKNPVAGFKVHIDSKKKTLHKVAMAPPPRDAGRPPAFSEIETFLEVEVKSTLYLGCTLVECLYLILMYISYAHVCV